MESIVGRDIRRPPTPPGGGGSRTPVAVRPPSGRLQVEGRRLRHDARIADRLAASAEPATVALVLAFALLPALALSADAASATRTLRARIGPGGTNGTATLRLFRRPGTVAESVRRLQPHVTYSQGIYHGVCGSLASRTIRLPNVKATRTGLVVRT